MVRLWSDTFTDLIDAILTWLAPATPWEKGQSVHFLALCCVSMWLMTYKNNA